MGPSSRPGSRQGLLGRLAARCHHGEPLLDGPVAGGELNLVDIVQLKILLEPEEVFRFVVSGKRGSDFILRGAATEVSVSRKESRIGGPGHDVAKDTEAGFCMRWTQVPAD